MWRSVMVKNDQPVDNRHHGMVRERSETQTPSGYWVRCVTKTGRLRSSKQNGLRFNALGWSNKKALLEAF